MAVLDAAAGVPRLRGQGHNRAARRHGGNRLAHQIKHPVEVDRHGGLPLRIAHAAQQLVFVNRSGGHQKIQPAKRSEAGLHQGLRIGRLACVITLGAHLLGTGVQTAGQGDHSRLVDVSHHHAGAAGMEVGCGRPTNAAASTRHEQHPVFEIKHAQPGLGLLASPVRTVTAQTGLPGLACSGPGVRGRAQCPVRAGRGCSASRRHRVRRAASKYRRHRGCRQ